MDGVVIERIRSAQPPAGMRTSIIAVDGFGGAGKTTLASDLAAQLDAQVVHTDDFASWEEPLEWWPRLRDQVLVPISVDQAGRFQRYDWHRRELAEWHDVPPAPFLIIEGVSASREEFRPFIAFAIWVEAPAQERLRRGLLRDGDGARAQWDEWMEQEAEWADRQRPQQHADLVVPGYQGL